MFEVIIYVITIAFLLMLAGVFLWFVVPIIFQIIVTTVMFVGALFRALFERLFGKSA